MEVELMSARVPPQATGGGGSSAQTIYALHGPEASLELSMLAAVASLSPDALPLLPALLGRRTPAAAAPGTAPGGGTGAAEGLGLVQEGLGLGKEGLGIAQEGLGLGEEGTGLGAAGEPRSAAGYHLRGAVPDQHAPVAEEALHDVADAALNDAVAAAVEEGGLNEEQADVLRSVGAWFGPAPEVRCCPGHAALNPVAVVPASANIIAMTPASPRPYSPVRP